MTDKIEIEDKVEQRIADGETFTEMSKLKKELGI